MDGLFGSAPAFIMFDGHHLSMEDMFAFSLAETESEWEQERALYGDEDEDTEDFIVEDSLVSGDSDEDDDSHESFDTVWKSSYVNWSHVTDRKDFLFALAFPLSELITDLKARREGQKHVDSLNAAYDALRRSEDASASEAAAGQLVDRLEKTCQVFPELTAKCADFQSRLDEVLRRAG
jgi:hypothetical protein